jgi:hypothetical protein
MHAVGIKRVFWTNADGGWEGAKVRDLVEALENGIESDGDGPGTGQENKGVFVTKHEVSVFLQQIPVSHLRAQSLGALQELAFVLGARLPSS